MSTVKVYEIAADLKMDPEAVLQKIKALGIDAKNKMSKIDATHVDHIRTQLLKDRQASFVEVEVAPGVRKLKRVEPAAPPPPPARPAPARPATPPSRPRTVEPSRLVEAAPEPAPAPAEVNPEPAAPSEPPASNGAQTAAPVEHRAEPEHREPAPAPEASVAPVAPPAPEAPPAPPPASTSEAPAEPRAEAKQGAPAEVAPAVEEPSRPEPPAAEAAGVEGAEAEASQASEPPARTSAPPPPPGAQRPAASAAAPPTEKRSGITRWDPVTKQVVHEAPRPMSGSRGSVPPPPPGARPAAGAAAGAPRVGKDGFREVINPQATRMMPRPGAARPGVGGATGSRPGLRPSPMRGGPSVPSRQVIAQETAQHKKVIKIEAQVSLQELARRMSLKATEVLVKLIQMGEVGKNINSTLDSDTAKLLAQEFGYSVEDVALNIDDIIKKALPEPVGSEAVHRAPVVTVMGHVDHGKTTLLDAIIGTRVAEGEAGGITQEVRAYRVNTKKGAVVFFDTPGHEAFTALRARGAKLTDVAVLVVAADDGVMPTTIEAIHHAKAAKVPLVVALNKMDRPDAQPDRVIQQLMQHDVIPEEFGGDVLVAKVSAKSRLGLDGLLETLALQTELLELKADPKKAGVGTVFEAKLDKGRGAVARVLVQEGTVRNGDVVLVGSAYGRIRAMFDDRGKPLDKAGPSTPVEILGLSEVPNAGDRLYVSADLRKAQEVAEQLKALAGPRVVGQPAMGDLLSRALEAQKGGQQINVNVVIKADAQGAVEGLKQALTSLSTEKVRVSVIHGAVGAITETDVQLASASNAVIIGFNVRPAGKAHAVADEQRVALRFYNVIYEAVDDIKKLMVGQLKPTMVEKALGRAEIRQVFNITKVGIVAGCMVVDGVVKRSGNARLVRDGAVKWEGKLSTLRRIKEDVREVANGFECGIALENTPDIKVGDIIEVFELEEVAATL